MNAPWKAGGNRDPFAAFICDEASLDVLRPVAIEMGWQPEKCAKGGHPFGMGLSTCTDSINVAGSVMAASCSVVSVPRRGG